MGQKLGSIFSGWFWLRVSWSCSQVGGWGWSLWRLEQAGNVTSKVVFAPGFWQEASSLPHAGLSIRAAWTSSQYGSWPSEWSQRDSKEDATVPFREKSRTSPPSDTVMVSYVLSIENDLLKTIIKEGNLAPLSEGRVLQELVSMF